MNLAFYSAATGAGSQQNKLNVLANNVANVNNDGYQKQGSRFQNLIYQNFKDGLDVNQGSGAKLAFTTFNFGGAALSTTGSMYDYAIEGNGFFAVRNPVDGKTYYTRSGSFQISEWQGGQFYLTTPTGELVLDRGMNPIAVENENQQLDIGIFQFAHTEGFTAVGNNLYQPGAYNAAPTVNEEATLIQGSVEASNVELSQEMVDMIEAQRLFQMTLRMLQTADEIENTINNFR